MPDALTERVFIAGREALKVTMNRFTSTDTISRFWVRNPEVFVDYSILALLDSVTTATYTPSLTIQPYGIMKSMTAIPTEEILQFSGMLVVKDTTSGGSIGFGKGSGGGFNLNDLVFNGPGKMPIAQFTSVLCEARIGKFPRDNAAATAGYTLACFKPY